MEQSEKSFKEAVDAGAIVLAAQLHIGQLVTGQVRVNVNAEKASVKITPDFSSTGVFNGVLVTGYKTFKFITAANTQSVDLYYPGQEKPIVATK